VQSKDTVGALKNALAKVASLDGSALDLCDVWGHRVYRTFSDNFSVEHIKANDELVAFELGERDRAIDVLCGRVSRYASADRQSPYELFGRPLRIAVTSSTTCGDVREVVRACVKRFASESSYKLCISTAAGTRFESDLPSDSELLPKEVATLTLEFKSDEGYDEDESDKVEEHSSCAENGHRDINLVDCFRKFAEKEQLGETEMWYCGKCKEHQRAYKKLDLWSAPEILILHLKRFQYAQNTYFVHRQKLDDRVAFPVENLDLSPCVLDPESRRSAQYDLYAVSEHSGGLGGGHYTATAKDDNTGVWYHYNDSVVSRADGVVPSDPKAYVLFYKRRPGKSS
jgi:ubiquitin carboxyl-terminal hydrolase 4/11/15